MPQELTKDFRGGLDVRKFMLSAPAGTLTRIINGHITAGAEIEKRKAFVRPITPPNTFGAEPITAGIVVFGSVDYTGTTFPAPFIYVRCTTPSGAAMTDVVWSTSFNDKTFVIATFSDGITYAFYDGKIVQDFISGLVSPVNFNPATGTQAQSIATGLAGLVNATSQYTAVDNGDGTFDVFSIPNTVDGNPYTVAITLSSAAGTLASANIGAGSAATAAGIATGSFQIVAGANDVSGVLTTDGTNPADASTVTIGSITYRFKTTPAAINDVQIGADAATTLANLSMATGASGTAGTSGTFNYYTGTVANTSATAGAVSGSAITVNSIITGSVAVSQSGTTHLTWSGLSGGATGNLSAATANYVSSIKVGALEILGANIAFAKDLTTTIASVVNQIISYSAAHPDGGGNYFSAASNGNIITLSTHAGTAAYNGAVITVVAHGLFFCDNCVFTITGTSFTCDYVNIAGVNAMTSVLTFPANTEQLPYFAQRICANINAGSSGYKALAVPGTAAIYVSKSTTLTTDALVSIAISLTGTAGGGTGNSNPLTVAASSASTLYENSGVQSGITLSDGSARWLLFNPVTVVASGGVPPYSYTYTIQSALTAFNTYYLAGNYVYTMSPSYAVMIDSGYVPVQGGSPPVPLSDNSASATASVFIPSFGSQFIFASLSNFSATPFSGRNAAVVSLLYSVQVKDSVGAIGTVGPITAMMYAIYTP